MIQIRRQSEVGYESGHLVLVALDHPLPLANQSDGRTESHSGGYGEPLSLGGRILTPFSDSSWYGSGMSHSASLVLGNMRRESIRYAVSGALIAGLTYTGR